MRRSRTRTRDEGRGREGSNWSQVVMENIQFRDARISPFSGVDSSLGAPASCRRVRLRPRRQDAGAPRPAEKVRCALPRSRARGSLETLGYSQPSLRDYVEKLVAWDSLSPVAGDGPSPPRLVCKSSSKVSAQSDGGGVKILDILRFFVEMPGIFQNILPGVKQIVGC